MRELKLKTESGGGATADRLMESDRESLPFPRVDWVELRRAGKAGPGDGDPVERALEIDRAIERLQRRIDEARDDLNDAYRMPEPDDWPPSAA